MPKRRYEHREPTHDWQQLRLHASRCMLLTTSSAKDAAKTHSCLCIFRLICCRSVKVFNSPFVLPIQVCHFAIEANWKPDVIRHGGIGIRRYLGRLLWRVPRVAAKVRSKWIHHIRCIGWKIRQPPVCQSDVEFLLVWVLEDRTDLRMEGCTGRIVGMRVA